MFRDTVHSRECIAFATMVCQYSPGTAQALLEAARDEMQKAAEREDEDVSVAALQEVLTRFADYPAEVQPARDLLSNRIRNRSAEVSTHLLCETSQYRMVQ